MGYSERHSHDRKMTSKDFTRFLGPEPAKSSRDIEGACPRKSVMENFRKRLRNIGPEEGVEHFYWGGTEYVLKLVGTSMKTTHLSTFELLKLMHCSRLTQNTEFCKNVIEMPYGWTNLTCHSSFQQYLDEILFNGLIARGSMLHLQPHIRKKNKAVPDRRSWQRQLVHNK